MAKIVIHAPKKEIGAYLDEVVRQVADGYQSGYVEQGVYWESKGVNE